MLDYPVDLLARILQADLRGSGEGRVRGVCTDSRTARPGDLFFALGGENTDGHRFVAGALERGAVGAVVCPDRVPERVARGGAMLQVADPLQALGALAAWHRGRHSVRVVGVTGSVGKTTTKDLVAGLLSQQWKTLKNAGNLNTEIGLPLSLLEIRPEHQIVVLEMAMRGPGQISYLARLARPEVAVITNIGLSHLEVMGTQDAIAAAKAEILDYLPSGGAAVLNVDDGYFSFLRGRVPGDAVTHGFGCGTAAAEGVVGAYLGAGPRPQARSGDGTTGTRFTLRGAREKSVRWGWLPLLGRHNMLNGLAAAAVAQAMGVSWPRILRGLADAEVSGMRMSVHRLRDGSTVLDDAYNASSPETMLAALEVLGEQPTLRRIAVLGSMLELGDASAEAHRRVGTAAAQIAPSLLVTVGESAREIADSAVASGHPVEDVAICTDHEEAVAAVASRRRAGDVILVKGSRGMAMERIVQKLRDEGGS